MVQYCGPPPQGCGGPPPPGPGCGGGGGYGGGCPGYGGPPPSGGGYGGPPPSGGYGGGPGYGGPGYGGGGYGQGGYQSGPLPGPGYYGGPQPGPGYGAPGETLDVFVDVSPEIQPTFNRAEPGRYVLDVPPIRVRLMTSCNPPPPQEPGLSPFKPHEEFMVTLPGIQRIFFDGNTGVPISPANSQVHKRGAILEVPPRVTLNAQIRSNSPFGSLILEDLVVQGEYRQKLGETVLNYKLQVDGQMSVNKGGGNRGANRLEVDLDFSFTCSLGGSPIGAGGPGGTCGPYGGPCGGPSGPPAYGQGPYGGPGGPPPMGMGGGPGGPSAGGMGGPPPTGPPGPPGPPSGGYEPGAYF